MVNINRDNPELFHSIGLLIEKMIPEAIEAGLPGINHKNFFRQLEERGELEQFFFQFTELIKSVEEKTNLDFSQFALNEFLENKDFKKGLTKDLGVVLLDHYYLMPEVRKHYSQNIPAPFPKGNNVEALDLELLERVYLRGKLYREAEHVANFQ